ncbi:MAG: hypothetical protein NWF05_10480 [Candidatus Bathyarchaeota archaeon]|nr:hypothetical protein [Candidatus Bathyarchaeota archaeon]
MGETKSLLGSMLNPKLVGYFLILWGLTFLFGGLADGAYYIANYNTGFGESTLETVFYLLRDTIMVVAAIVLWVISAKLLAKNN